MAHTLVTGAPTAPNLRPGDSIPSRLEIKDFIKKVDHFSLYIQALQNVFDANETNPLSYYQISGIHGMPYVSWSGSPGGQQGYCIHKSVLFPTWHRPFIALLEQAIQKEAVAIASGYTVDKARFQQAAVELRQPYWDWAKPDGSLPPEVISMEQVTIIKKDGSRGPVPNPLLRYKFPKGKQSIFPSPWSQWGTTLRNPTSMGGDAQPDIERLKNTLEGPVQTELTQDTLALLTLVHTWDLFSNRATSSGGFTNSVEAIHDSIHVYIGGRNKGHMGEPAVAAFDPIFYLHHANVDRLFSLWAAINPNVDVSNQRKFDATGKQVVFTSSTDLLPFWNTSNTIWSSKPLVASTKALGYTYPEFKGFETATPAKLAAHVLEEVQRLYGNVMKKMSPAAPLKSDTSKSVAPTQQGAEQQPLGRVVADPIPDLPPSIVTPVSSTTWTARVRCNHHDMQGSFSIFLFIGDVPEDPIKWRTAPSYVGSDDVFIMGAETKEQCANCQTSDEPTSGPPASYIEGYIHLNSALREANLPSLEPDVVTPFLRKNLQWRVRTINCEVVWLNSLEVVVIHTPLELPEGSLYPTVGQPEKLNGVTYGRSGGARKAPAA